MALDLPRLFLARHGDTAWTDTGQHTGRTDQQLNERGLEHARRLGAQLQRYFFAQVFSSPLKRALKTCTLELLSTDRSVATWIWPIRSTCPPSSAASAAAGAV